MDDTASAGAGDDDDDWQKQNDAIHAASTDHNDKMPMQTDRDSVMAAARLRMRQKLARRREAPARHPKLSPAFRHHDAIRSDENNASYSPSFEMVVDGRPSHPSSVTPSSTNDTPPTIEADEGYCDDDPIAHLTPAMDPET
ncbi:hypothetical protein L249_5064 [Ophiocordyceps polyrhachis-furcata BCC 54312]|uniref:Uncharacterized protein n=1 Tax=Ophiocordyceps polyrhachis-furcata BCC 54312 TaxID=1330021 RepID=A0A367L3T3_9HYPO|nr:hypothetical protein L249_5064 [Ophiocordyceps polyrhachis-furcata BCC 54312]